MRALIVGCGYVGVPLGAELVKQGHEVFGLRRSGRSPAMEAAGIAPLTGDITKPESLAKLPATYDWVVNCVSSSGGGVNDYRQVYLEGTRNLLDWLAGRPSQRFVYTSSTSVYGQTDGSEVTEASATEPSSDTSAILLETEQSLQEAVKQRLLPAVILRVAGIYGPDRGYWFRQYLQGQARIEGKGERILNMIHRDDVIGAIVAALCRGHAGRIYNVVDDEPVSQWDYFQWLSAKLGRGIPPVAEDSEAAFERGSTNKRVSNHKLKTELGYSFKYPTFREGYAEEIRRAIKPAAP